MPVLYLAVELDVLEEGVAEVGLGIVTLGHVGAELGQGLGLVIVWKFHKFIKGNRESMESLWC